MEEEIKRWATLSSHEHFPGERVTLIPRGKSPVRSKIRAQYAPQRRPRVPAHYEREYMVDLLNRLANDQRRDVGVLMSGYLSPDATNKRFREVGAAFDTYAHRKVAEKQQQGHEPNTAEKTDHEDNVQVSDVPDTKADDQEKAHHITDLHDILFKYDAVKLHDRQPSPIPNPNLSPKQQRKLKFPELPAHVRHHVIPTPQLGITKHDEWKAYQEIDAVLDRRNWMDKPRRYAKADRLQSLYEFLRRELESLGAPEQGPDFRRLQVYSAVWDKIIAEFKHYGPIMAEIKNEYDKTIANFQSDQRELNFLRTKVQKLLSQNENRLLLKFERKKCRDLEKMLVELEEENKRLKEDLRRKLTLYASYLPSAVLEKKRKEDAELNNIAEDIAPFKLGEDPISLYEKKIETLETQATERDEELATLKKVQAEQYVPRVERDTMATSLKEAQAKLQQLREQNAALDKELSEHKAELEDLTAQYKEKQEQYQYMYKEYTELSEAVAVSFDNKVLKKE